MNQFRWLACVLASLAVLLAGCSATLKGSDPTTFTAQALAETDPAKIAPVEKGSSVEKLAIEQFKTFNSNFSNKNIREHIKEIYATNIYFCDPFKSIHGETDLELYLRNRAGFVKSFSMEWLDVSESHGNYYFRWVMSIAISLDSDDTSPPEIRADGISHVRFGQDGKVVFRHDYFDGTPFVIYKIPIGRSGVSLNRKGG